MCGICGQINGQRDRRVDAEELRVMTSTLSHRGPDDEGYYHNDHVGLGFRRLSIIDLSTGHQPLSNEDGTVWIVFNGEIYNYRELRSDLLARGHRFSTLTDTEVIVHAYEEYGKRCVEKLRGMFAFAIWDDRRQQLFCARDRFGIKPFFYSLRQDQFVFASEIKALLALQRIPDTISLPELDHYLAYGYMSTTGTIYESIVKLPAAHHLTLIPGQAPAIERYWNINWALEDAIDEETWSEMLLEKLKEAIRIRLVSDVPLGAFLSGGIDSSAVVALMAMQMDQPVQTFSIGFQDPAFNELPYANKVAAHCGTRHRQLIVEPESVAVLPKLVAVLDEPFADQSAIPTYFVSKFAREYVTVILSGDGGDELFAGYDQYQKFLRISALHHATGGMTKPLWQMIHSILPNTMPGKGLSFFMSRPPGTAAAYLTKWHLPSRERLYRSEHLEKLGNHRAETQNVVLLKASTAPDDLSRLQELDMRTWLTEDILTKVDRMSMFTSLEVRVPLLDHELAEMSFRMPASLKLHSGEGKYLLKKVMRSHLPPEIMSRSKKGFAMPFTKWFKHDLHDYLADELLNGNSPLQEYIRPEPVRKLLQEHKRGLRDLHPRIWSLVVLQEWLRQRSDRQTGHRLSEALSTKTERP